MQKNYFLFLILIIPYSSYSQNEYKDISIPPNKLTLNPPGTISINDTLFIDKGPINNLNFLFFIQSVSNSWNLSIHDSIKKLPNFNVSETIYKKRIKNNENDKLSEQLKLDFNTKITDNISSYDYRNYPQYSFNPVLLVSREQAELYCKWRTDMVMLVWATRTKTKDERNKYPEKIKYRLPTTEELVLAKDFFYEKGQLKISNHSSPIKMKLKKKRERFYVYNVSELTSNTSAYGKNWLNKKLSDKPNNYTSFRCICEVSK